MALLIMASVLSAMVLLGASAAHADPCKAIPDTGPLPGYLYPGARFAGPVVHIGDGDSLCVAVGAGPQNWVEVRISGFYAPELHEPDGKQAKAALSSIARGRSAVCVADHQSYDRIVARCYIGGRLIGDLMRQAGVSEGGRGH